MQPASNTAAKKTVRRAAVVPISNKVLAAKEVKGTPNMIATKPTKPRRTLVEVEATTPIPKTEFEAQRADLERDLVTVLVPKPFTLTRDGHQPIKYPSGMQEMPRVDAEHWWSRVNGVEVYVKASPKGVKLE